MIIKEYIKEFETRGVGMFVHFGLYSTRGRGEWDLFRNKVPTEEYESATAVFCPEPDWAEKLVAAAKGAGCKYITLTTRHHDGFSLYDTLGLSEYDAPHTCGRDLIREYVDACRKEDIVPHFYHTLLDWHNPDYNKDFKKYLVYLRRSVEILCTQYGKIGGLWFDGMWDKWDADWEEDALYSLIRRHQPEAMIINNTGVEKGGQLGHIEIDSVTFERGKPLPINREGAPKYIASEMCEVFNFHWGYAESDFKYKSLAEIIETLCNCRKYGSNLLMNIGPMGNGYLRPIDAGMMAGLGEWVKRFDEAVRKPRPTDIEVIGKKRDFVLQDGKNYYAFCFDVPSESQIDIDKSALSGWCADEIITLDLPIASVTRLDTNEPLDYSLSDGKTTVKLHPYTYGDYPVVSVLKIVTK